MGDKEDKYKGLFLSDPFRTIYHIFGEDRFSLCGKIALINIDPERCVNVTGNETYKKGQDCKACFRKAGLNIEGRR